MLDFNRIEGFQWDEGNARKSENKHGVTQSEAEQVFFNHPLVLEDVKHSGGEPRFHALGETNDGRLLHVAFTLRDSQTMIRVISARPVNRKERLFYGKAS